MPENLQTGVGQVSLGFGNLYASLGDHIGHFYQGRAERDAIVVPFLTLGLEAGEKCICLMSPGPERQQLQETMASSGIDVERALASGQLVLDDGKSTPEELRGMLGSALAEIPTKFPFLRWVGEMTWSLGKVPTTEKLMEWEAHCNTVERAPVVFLCQYELTAFLGHVVMGALQTHPTCVVSNVVHQNPYYERPEVFLETLRRQPSTALAP